MKRGLALAGVMLGTLAFGQETKPAETPPPLPPPPLVSPEVHADRTVTFRLRAPAAKEVSLVAEWSRVRTPLTKDGRGDWSVTVGPLAPNVWGYHFFADGLAIPDKANPQLKLARSPLISILDLPADPPCIHDFQAVPRGTLRMHTYDSRSLGRRRGLYVYAPPDYDTKTKSRYPVLYLFHGRNDTEGTWPSLGRVNVILDNLIAQRKARPMLVVMPDGHPVYPMPATAEGYLANATAFERDLLEDVLPFIEAAYRVDRRPEGRAIAGTAMGGGQALLFGLRHTDVFAWVVGLSPLIVEPETAASPALLAPKATNARLKLLWFACGKTDASLEGNTRLAEALRAKGITHTFSTRDVEHDWPQWRIYLAEVAPMLFTRSPAEGRR